MGNRIFSAPFDPANSPERLNLKVAYVSHVKNTEHPSITFHDPYDVIANDFTEGTPLPTETKWLGRMPVDTWLRPRPELEDLNRLTPFDSYAFLQNNGCWKYATRVVEFVEEKVGCHRPVMIGVDHSLTGGVIYALAKQYSNLNMIVLDAHIDLLENHGIASAFPGVNGGQGHIPYHCGNFLSVILKMGIIRPENLWVLGIADAVARDCRGESGDNAGIRSTDELQKWIDRGVHLASKKEVASGEVTLALTGPTYVSIDMDVGSLSSVFSARFMNCYGLALRDFVDLIHTIDRAISSAHVPLVGLDIMEVDIHFLEAVAGMPFEDHTRVIAKEVLKSLLNNHRT